MTKGQSSVAIAQAMPEEIPAKSRPGFIHGGDIHLGAQWTVLLLCRERSTIVPEGYVCLSWEGWVPCDR